MKKVWDYMIKEFVLRMWKMYLLSREEREKVHDFIKEIVRSI